MTTELRAGRPPEAPAVHRVLFDRPSRLIAPWLLLGSFLIPAKGIGFSICGFKALTSLPCPSCGLGRSLACLSHLHFGESLHFHPFGPAVYGLLVFLVISSLIGEGPRTEMRKWLDRHQRGVRLGYYAFIFAFIGFGVARLGLSVLFPGWFADI